MFLRSITIEQDILLMQTAKGAFGLHLTNKFIHRLLLMAVEDGWPVMAEHDAYESAPPRTNRLNSSQILIYESFIRL